MHAESIANPGRQSFGSLSRRLRAGAGDRGAAVARLMGRERSTLIFAPSGESHRQSATGPG
jgi:hypothetical protein